MVLIILLELAFIAQRNLGIIPDRNVETGFVSSIFAFSVASQSKNKYVKI